MKKRILSILLVATMLLAMVPAMVVATSAESSVIDWDAAEITLMTADDFKAFHDQIHVKGKGAFADQVVKLGADIDMTGYTLTAFTASEADNYVGFAGVLDGQYHTLSGITMALSKNCTGFLGNPGYLDGANYKPHIEIKNLALINSTIGSSSISDIGGFYGMANAIVTFTNVYNAATINGKGNTGTFVQSTRWGSGRVIFNNCVYAGVKLNGSTSNTGFVGKLNHTNTNTSTFTNCVMAGSVRDASGNTLQNACTFIGSVNGKSVTYSNCIQYSDYFQTGAGVSAAVSQNCVGVGDGASAKAINGFTSMASGYPMPTPLAQNMFAWELPGTVIKLGTANEFKKFHDWISSCSRNFDNQTVLLTADIDMAGYKLFAPANTYNGFRGVFDGQYHTLSNISFHATITSYSGALFGCLGTDKDATIKNLGIVALNATTYGDCGVLYGNVFGVLNLENIYINATVNNTAETRASGGFIGRINTSDTATINTKVVFENCVYDGVMSAAQYVFSPFVGILESSAKVDELSFTNCVISGDFKRGNGEWLGAGKFICTNNQTTANITYTDCIQYNTYYQGLAAGFEEAGPQNAACPEWTGIGSGFTAKTPAGFTARNASYPVPTTLLPFFADSINDARTNEAEDLVTEYYDAQDRVNEDDSIDVRLVGLVNIPAEELTNYKAIGFEVVAVRQANGAIWTNIDAEGNATFVYDVYTSYLENGEEITVGDSYVYMYALEGIQANKGIVTFAIKTFYVDANGAKTYTDMFVLDYNTNTAA